MTQPESKLSNNIKKELIAHGGFVFKVWGSEFMLAGLPDLIGCYKGHFFGFEVKLPEKRSNTSPIQERIMQKIRDAGGASQVVCTAEESVNAMIALDE